MVGAGVKVAVGGIIAVAVDAGIVGVAVPQAVSRNKSRMIKMVRMGFLYGGVR